MILFLIGLLRCRPTLGAIGVTLFAAEAVSRMKHRADTLAGMNAALATERDELQRKVHALTVDCLAAESEARLLKWQAHQGDRQPGESAA
jgi:outer membrane murein-binding lipoprotein Lpp